MTPDGGSIAPDGRSIGPGGGSIAAGRRMAHGEQLARIARKHPERVAFVCGARRATFAEVDKRVTSLACALADRGVSAGDRVALLMGNSIEMIEAMFSAWRLGAIVVPINFRLVAGEVAFLLGDCGATALVVDAPLRPLVDVDVPLVVVLGAAAGGRDDFEDLVASGGTQQAVDVADGDPALILYTSGTTGRPKGAVLSHLNLVMSTLNSMITQGISGYDDVWYGNLPLFHVGGLSGILPYVIGGGCSIILPSGGFDAAQAVQDLARHGVTGCVFVGMQWDEICDQIAAQRPDLKLRRVAWGAANTPVHVLEKMQATLPGVPIFSFFGQTEMSPVTCVLHARDAERKRGSVGRPIVNVEARLVDDEGADVPAGSVGEIVYRGPTVMQGYWNMPEATEEAFRNGWFHSGDLCRMDDEGYLYVVDRKTDMIISGGENIYCPEVEGVLGSHSGVADVALIGVPHPTWGETPRAVVVPADPDSPPSEADLIEWCRSRLASYKKPTSVVFVAALPRNAGGKVVKPEVRRLYGGV